MIFPSRMVRSVIAIALISLSLAAKGETWRAGVAETDITPPIGYRVAGYFYERISTGVHDPLKAKVVVLENGTNKAALVFCDLVEMTLPVSAPARQEASAKTGIPISNILICATHSHTGPLFNDLRRDVFHEAAMEKYGKDPTEPIDYPKWLATELVNVIVKANANLGPAQLKAGFAQQEGLAFNRRYFMKNGKVAWNPGLLNTNIVKPAGPTDPAVPIVWVESVEASKTKPIGAITIFAMHADTTGGTEFSADYPFYLQEELRKTYGPDFISMFGAGTCGNINNINVSVDAAKQKKTPELGATLGKTVLAQAPKLEPIERPSLSVRSQKIVAPLQEVSPEQVAAARATLKKLSNGKLPVEAFKIADLGRRGKTWPMEVQVFRLGSDTAIVGLPAEIFVEFGFAIKKASPFKNTFVISICNDRPNYIPTLEGFAQGAYEAINSRVQPGTGEKLVEVATKLLKELKAN
jgi:neutral ceramidase